MNWKMLLRRCALLALMGPLVLALTAGAGGQAPAGRDLVTLSLKAVFTGTGHFTDGSSKADDELTISVTETDVWRIIHWAPNTPADLELVSSHSRVQAEGKGTLILPGDLPQVKWTYAASSQPAVPISGVWLNHDGHGSLQPANYSCVDYVKCVPQGTGEGLDTPYPMSDVFANATDVLSQDPAFMNQLRFTFPPDAKSAQATGHASCTSPATSGFSGIGKLTVDYTISLGVPAPEKESPQVVLQEIDRKWLPEESNSLTAHVTVQGDKNADAFRFTLYDISREPGTCLNSRYVGTNWDLSFASGKPWSIDPPDEEHSESWIATSETGGKSADIVIMCHDWGAWGKLRAEAEIDGKWQPAKVAGASRSFVRIPFDDDDDHIADSWEQKYGVKDSGDDSDSKPKGKSPGDGLTAYEEYRGFMVKGTHVRTDPTVKDLFVTDEAGFAEPGIALFEKITEIKVHLLSAAELLADRVINSNHDKGPHVVNQHAVRIIVDESARDAEASPMRPDTPVGTPRTVRWVILPPGTGPVTIAHELCHCVGLHHHGEGDYAALWTWKKDLMGNWQLYEQPFDRDKMKEGAPPSFFPGHPPVPIRAIREADLSEITHGNIGKYVQGNYYDPWGGYRMIVGVKGGAYSGEERCVMRYADADAYVSSEESDVRYLPWAFEYKGRDMLCDGQAGTGYNSKDHHPESRYGDATMGKCKQQIVVSDK